MPIIIWIYPPLDTFSFCYHIKVPTDFARSIMKPTKKHDCTHHIIEIMIIKIPMFYKASNSPSLINIHSYEGRIYTNI